MYKVAYCLAWTIQSSRSFLATLALRVARIVRYTYMQMTTFNSARWVGRRRACRGPRAEPAQFTLYPASAGHVEELVAGEFCVYFGPLRANSERAAAIALASQRAI
ncbi:hypothetical protein GQ53DRAFT_751955 [Thozetella sp. PMI_491]|nr:hypothetical protein GQ53DRAFT_751955 [Thozetella sp. PMI_491]